MINMATMYSKFVKYNVLHGLINVYPSTKVLQTTPVDIYIDVQSIYSQVLSQELLSTDNKIISINILNLAAHYRHFFRTIGTEARVFIVNGSRYCNNIASIENANNVNMYDIVKTLTPYFPCTYYIDKPYLGSAIIYSLIQQESHMYGHTAFVISNDIYAYQMPATLANTFLLRPVSHPKLITYNNVLAVLFSRTKTIDFTSLNPGLIPMMLAYHKCPELGLDMVNNLKTTVNLINQKISRGKLLNGNNALNVMMNNEEPYMADRIAMCDLIHLAKEYSYSYDNLDMSWKIYKPCDIQTLSGIIDSKVNTDPNNLLNYIFLMDISIEFVNRFMV